MLDGTRLDLESIAIDRRELEAHEYSLEPGKLIVHNPPAQFRLEIVTRIAPAANTALEGLYMSGGRFCTQCEAEGFRAITYALEVIAIFVAILGVATTLLTLILERSREIAMLRLVGADRRQIRKMVVIEAGLMGGVSQTIGLAIGLLLSLLLIYVINVQSFGWTIQFHLPAGFLLQSSALILIATALSGIYPARRASRMQAAAQISEE